MLQKPILKVPYALVEDPGFNLEILTKGVCLGNISFIGDSGGGDVLCVVEQRLPEARKRIKRFKLTAKDVRLFSVSETVLKYFIPRLIIRITSSFVVTCSKWLYG